MTSEAPWSLFELAYERALGQETFDASRCVLATVSKDGQPSARFVLLKGFDHGGFEVFTDYRSAKAVDLEANPQCALAFHWSSIGVQFRVEGRAHRTSDERSDEYFASRPRGSQIGAWASIQSAALSSRELLEEQVRALEKKFHSVAVPRPAHWGGYRIVPTAMELWENRDDRLHHRTRFVLTDGIWRSELLYP